MDCIKIKNGTSLVRIFHASPGTSSIDVYLNDKFAFDGIENGDFTRYVTLAKGQYAIDLYNQGTKENPLIETMIDIPEGEIFTIIAVGDEGDLSLLMLNDYENKIPSKDDSIFRVVHIAPNAPGINVIVNKEIYFTNLQFRENSSYVDIRPGTYNIDIVLTKTGKVVLPLSINLNPNRIYTIYVTGDIPYLGAVQSVDGSSYLCN